MGALSVRALLIGSDFYPPGPPSSTLIYSSLSACVRDAEKLAEWLRRSAGVPAGRIRKLTSTLPPEGGPEPPEPPAQRPTYENMVRELRRLIEEAAPGDQILIYYAGHGGRVRTCIPAVKGRDGIDEALVPYDAGSAGARYLRDVELAEILRALAGRGAFVTLALDCCHAGGANRLEVPEGVGIRGTGAIDTTSRPRDSLVAPPERLAATWLAGKPSVRSLEATSGWLTRPQGYVLLAACRAHEIAIEHRFEGETCGVFTRSLLAGLQHLAPDLTYRRLHDRIVAEVRGRFEVQTPVLEGEGDRVVFGEGWVSAPPTANILRVEKGGRRLLVDAGRVQGVERRARFAVFSGGTRAAVAQVTVAGAAVAWTRVVERPGPAPIELGARAVLLDAGAPRLRRGVSLNRTKEDERGRRALDAVAEILKSGGGNGFVGIVGAAKESDFVVSADPGERRFEVRDPAGARLPGLPSLAIDAPDAAGRLVEHLIHLAKFRNLQRLDNSDLQSPLRGTLRLELGGLPQGWTTEDEPVFVPLAERPDTLACGDWACARIVNTSKQTLNLGVLDLQPDWGVRQVFPASGDADCATLEAGQALLLPLRADLPPGLAAGIDLLKVVASSEWIKLRWLELPALGTSSRNGAGRRSGPADPLAALFAAFTADRLSTRALEPSRYSGREWTVAHLEIPMARPPGVESWWRRLLRLAGR